MEEPSRGAFGKVNGRGAYRKMNEYTLQDCSTYPIQDRQSPFFIPTYLPTCLPTFVPRLHTTSCSYSSDSLRRHSIWLLTRVLEARHAPTSESKTAAAPVVKA
jgi:hypothetical protein